MRNKNISIVLVICFFALSCQSNKKSYEEKKAENTGKEDTVATTTNEVIELPAPYATKSVSNFSDVVGWPAGKTPLAPAGFSVTKFADSLKNPRWIYIGPNGDVFVAESNAITNILKEVKAKTSGKGRSGNTSQSANTITLLRDANHDGIPELRSVFLKDLNQPFGMLIMGNNFYVGNTNGITQFAYQPGQTQIKEKGKKILELPAGGYNNHWTRNLFASKDGNKIYVTVGSGSNVGEHGMDNEIRRADILEINPDGSGEIIYASGLRNPQGMGYAPASNTLYTVVNERDELGDELVPDYLTSIKKGGFYGWPYSYWGQHEDPRMKDKQRPDLVKQAIVPDLSMGAHTASLGLAFDENNSFPGKYRGGAFIGQHGSWNRSKFSGYQVVFVPFKNGKASGGREPFLTNFIADEANRKVYGRPVGVAFTQQGDLLVADDAGNAIWRVSVVLLTIVSSATA